ncbi:DNA pol B 2 domain-containing protein [Aphis craccivora]|uniref:DNA pol B 2 domain-containing protein n=1 Tax=Aphis craccivora TaxID=307492 RepID=A0A6G0YA78_APHCR|nr:DNA pol B 2 domain-containing protein [Aphis craccivora]
MMKFVWQPWTISKKKCKMITQAFFKKKKKNYTTSSVNGKLVSTANTLSAARSKKKRIPIFFPIPWFCRNLSIQTRTIVWYYTKNTGDIKNYTDFLRSLKSDLKQILKARLQEHPIKFNYSKSLKRYFGDNTGAFVKLLNENETYASRGSGFTLESIDELLLPIYKYMPIGGLSYIQLPAFIDRKRATINPQSLDQQCFKWAIPREACNGIDHNHLTGKFRQTLCSKFNLELQQPKFLPVFFHNLSNYDSHFIITELGFDTASISVILNCEEKYISLTKHISSKFTIRFIDTFRFMASSLSSVIKNLITQHFENFRETAKHCVREDTPLVTRKAVYPYTDSWGKLHVSCFPRKEELYSALTESGIKEEDFEHAKAVWDNLKCKTLGEYSDLYLKIDVLLLADVFENFLDLCMYTNNLDAAHYYTAPGLSFDAMLKYTGQKL